MRIVGVATGEGDGDGLALRLGETEGTGDGAGEADGCGLGAGVAPSTAAHAAANVQGSNGRSPNRLRAGMRGEFAAGGEFLPSKIRMAGRNFARYPLFMTTIERIHEVCRYIDEHADEPLALDALAKRALMSKFHFARRFKSVVGVTPKQYAARARLDRFKKRLKDDAAVDGALYDAGYGSPSRVYENAARNLGMTPSQYRASGKGVSISYTTLQTPIGLMLIGATDRGICFAQFGDSRERLLDELRSEYRNADIAAMREPPHPQLAVWAAAIARHLDGEACAPALPLDIRATAFQMRVWTYLQSIPSGEVRSYGEVAAAIGGPKAARAVGNACARNRVAIAIPCHRVIRESGDLGGYRWGLERKRTLLDLERRQHLRVR